jgi:hypothetical protein
MFDNVSSLKWNLHEVKSAQTSVPKTNNKFYIKTLKLAQFSEQMSVLILPHVNPA